MDSSDIVRMLNSNHYSPANLEEVNDLCRNYPMFGLAHMLKVRIKESLGHDKAADLRVASIYSIDRKKLFELVTDLKQVQTSETEEEPVPFETGGIHFSDEPHQQADVIIEQHAPYAVPEPSEDLLELDEDEEQDVFTLDVESENSFTSESLIEAVVKEESEMEDPGPEMAETPLIDEVDQIPHDSVNHKLIDSFIQEEPGPIRADKYTNLKGDASLSSIREHDGFITDTLAKIYLKQGLYAKAIYAYEKLSLKYPEKSAYFAAQIEKIRNINRS